MATMCVYTVAHWSSLSLPTRYEPGAMEVTQWVPLPTKQQLGGFLPSPTYPSDHLAVVADLTFRKLLIVCRW